MDVYVIVAHYNTNPFRYDVLGIFSTEEKALGAFAPMVEEDDGPELQIEAWPLDAIKTRFNVAVVAGK